MTTATTAPSLGDFDALSFDCYGTLIDWEAGIAAVLRRWAGRSDQAGPAPQDPVTGRDSLP